MGLQIRQIRFEGPAPPIEVIVERAGALSGLRVKVKDEPRVAPEVREICGLITFEELPDFEVELMVGSSRRSQSHSVDIRCHVMSDPTLLNFLTVALESLGGTLIYPDPGDFRQDCSAPITLEELKRRHARAQRQARVASIMFVCLSPVLVPLMLIKLILFVICLPVVIFLAHRRLRRARFL